VLDPRDQTFLSLAVARGVVPEARALELSTRYRGLPGGLAQALVELGVITAEGRLRVEAELVSAELRARTPGTGRLPPGPPPLTPMESDRTRTDSQQTVYTDDVIQPPPSSSVLESDDPPAPPAHLHTIMSGLLGPRVRLPGYEFEAELGRGGMGVVYRAKKLLTGELVAIKLLLEVSPRHRQRFSREAKALQRLEHPHVVGILDVGESADGQPYIVMPYLPGGDFRAALARGAIELPKALSIMAKVARAIAHAHSQNVVHRDLKPGNVLLDADLEPRVTDFGLAKILDHESQLTRTGVALGTPQYMAPEQVRCADPGPQADVHALGVMLFQILTLELPYAGAGAALFQAIVNDRPPKPWELKAGVPRDLGLLTLAALEKAPDDRPTALALAEALEAHLAGRAIVIRPRSAGRRGRRAAAAVLGAVLGGATVGLGLAAAAGRGAPEADPRAVREALAALDVSLADAQRARATSVDGMTREAEVHRGVAAHVERARASAPGLLREVEARYAASGARTRRAEVLGALAPRLLARGDVDGARRLARERVDVDPDAVSLLLLARALAADPATGAEACRLAVLAVEALPAGAEASLAEQVVSQAADALLLLHRPGLAVRVLDARPTLPPGLLALRGRALLLAGDVARARADLAQGLAQAAVGPSRDVALAVALAEVEVRLGRPKEALAALDAAKAGGDPRWLGARARALEAAGDLRAAWRVHDEAVALEPARAAARGRFHLRRGRVVQALDDLAAARDPTARLDRALAVWLTGGSDDAALRALWGVVDAARACGATAEVGAAAAQWVARVEVARARPAAAAQAAALAWQLAPGPDAAATLAWALARAGRPTDALEALARAPARTPEGRLVEAQALVALGRTDDAQGVVAELPERFPGRADLVRALALRAGSKDEVALAERAAHALRRAAFAAPAAGAVPAPVASEPPATPLHALVDRLAVETRRARPEPARHALLAARVLALDPAHTPTRLALVVATGDRAALDQLAAAFPHLVDVRQARLKALLRTEVAVADLVVDHGLLRGPEFTPDERLSAAQALAGAEHLEPAWALLEPALKDEPLHAPSLRALAQLAIARGDAAVAAEAERALAEHEAVLRDQWAVRRASAVTVTRLVEARDALALWTRHLDHDADYYLKTSHYENNSLRQARSVVAGGRYLLCAQGVSAAAVYYWSYAYGYVPVSPEGETALELIEREAARRPEDPALFAARALYLLARHHSRQAQPGDALAAAEAALHAVDLAPDVASVLALAADASIEAGDFAEAAALARTALALDSSCTYAVFQQARLAARAGDVEGVGTLLHVAGRPDIYGDGGYTFQRDPCFAPVREDPRLRASLAR
jgi:serine/threonine-protein kinase